MKVMENLYVDMHIHSSLKPFGHYHKNNNPDQIHERLNEHPPSINKSDSIWYYDPPSVIDKFINYLPPNLARFRKSDFSSISRSKVRIVSGSMYPLEKGFVNNKLGTGFISDFLVNLASGLGKARIDHLQAMNEYFSDLENEYNFYKWWNGRKVDTGWGTFQYQIMKNYAHLVSTLNHNPNTIAVILSIEGGHVFNTGLNPEKGADEREVLENIHKVKKWEYKPFFITLAHHFYNEICGHAKSLPNIIDNLLDQSRGLGEGITPLGYKVIEKLLDPADGRILIDIKHMSPQSRNEFYQVLQNNYQQNPVPFFVSHGAVNGIRSYNDYKWDFLNTAPLFKEAEINFYDEELVKIARSGGIFSLELDERIIASNAAQRKAAGRLKRDKILFHRAKLVWNNIQHIARVLDAADLFPWGIAAIGSDYDGGIDPLNGFWTEEDLDELATYLLMHAQTFMENEGKNLHNGRDTSPEEIVNRIMRDNALNFIEKFFN